MSVAEAARLRWLKRWGQIQLPLRRLGTLHSDSRRVRVHWVRPKAGPQHAQMMAGQAWWAADILTPEEFGSPCRKRRSDGTEQRTETPPCVGRAWRVGRKPSWAMLPGLWGVPPDPLQRGPPTWHVRLGLALWCAKRLSDQLTGASMYVKAATRVRRCKSVCYETQVHFPPPVPPGSPLGSLHFHQFLKMPSRNYTHLQTPSCVPLYVRVRIPFLPFHTNNNRSICPGS